MSYSFQGNNGRILYVSKSGDNASARIGDPDRPWPDPWAAVAAMSAGDLIYVFSGTWTIGDLASGADLETDSVTGANLLTLSDQSFHFEPGARIEVIDTVRVYELFTHSSTESFNLKISGKGQFEFLESGKLFNIDTTGAVNVDFEADEVTGLWFNRIATEGEKVSYKVNFTGTDLTLAPLFDFGTATGCEFYFHADNIIYGVDTGQDANVDNGIFKIRRGTDMKASLNVGNIISYKKSHVGVILGIGGACTNNKINININNIDAYDPFITNGTYSSYTIDETTIVNGTSAVNALGMLFRIPEGDTIGNIMNINIGTCSTHIPLLGQESANLGVTNQVRMHVGSATCKANNPLFFNENGANVSDEVILTIDRGESANGALIMEGTLKWMGLTLSGFLKTTSAGDPVIIYQGSNLTRNPMKIQNARLVNDGTVDVIAPITGSNARSFIIQNVVTNTLVNNADVTEDGQSMTRDADYA